MSPTTQQEFEFHFTDVAQNVEEFNDNDLKAFDIIRKSVFEGSSQSQQRNDLFQQDSMRGRFFKSAIVGYGNTNDYNNNSFE